MDLRTERTKRSIINAFIDLRAKKPLEKITVKELSELAYINKATFYSYYHDIYDLAEHLEEEAITSVLKSISYPADLFTNPKQCMLELALALYAQNSLFHILFSGTRSAVFSNKLEQGIRQQIFEKYPEYQEDLRANILISLLIQGCLHAFLAYSDKDFEEVIQILGDINDCLIKNYWITKNPCNANN